MLRYRVHTCLLDKPRKQCKPLHATLHRETSPGVRANESKTIRVLDPSVSKIGIGRNLQILGNPIFIKFE